MTKEEFWKKILEGGWDAIEKVSMGLVNKTADYLKKHPKEDIVEVVLEILEDIGAYDPNEIEHEEIMEAVAENMPLDTGGSLYDFISVTIDRLAAYYEENEDEF